jgi:hypothetical protein
MAADVSWCECEIVSRSAAKLQFAFAILQQYCARFLRTLKLSVSLRIGVV